MAPVGWKVSAWSTRPEWWTRSRRGRGAVDPEAGPRGEQQPAGAAAGGQAPRDGFENRVDQSVLGARRIAGLDVHLPVRAGQAAQQYPRGPGSKVMAAVVAADGHGVSQDAGAGCRPVGGFQRHGL